MPGAKSVKTSYDWLIRENILKRAYHIDIFVCDSYLQCYIPSFVRNFIPRARSSEDTLTPCGANALPTSRDPEPSPEREQKQRVGSTRQTDQIHSAKNAEPPLRSAPGDFVKPCVARRWSQLSDWLGHFLKWPQQHARHRQCVLAVISSS